MITLDRALREFITTQTHLAIVVNEYGEVEG
jgi:CBS domain containing-hemolysin-like protein